MSGAERLVSKFSEVWASPEPDKFAALWHPEGRLLHSGTEHSIEHTKGA